MVTGEITTSDMSVVLDCVYRLHAARGRTELLTVAVEELARLVRCDTASLTVVDAPRGVVEMYDYPTGSLRGTAELLADDLDEHPAVAHYLATRDSTPRAISELVPRQQWRSTGLYRTMFRPFDVADQLVVPIANDGDGGVGVGLNRSTPGFTDRERARLELVRPHLAQAYAAVVRLEALQPGVDDSGLAALTAREREVLELVGLGLTDRQIAAKLHLSDRTVSKHVENLKAKLGVRTRTAAAVRVINTRAG
jgi:DNA-binding CsgD family transcriptional regulator